MESVTTHRQLVTMLRSDIEHLLVILSTTARKVIIDGKGERNEDRNLSAATTAVYLYSKSHV
jgi:hypothetical protein